MEHGTKRSSRGGLTSAGARVVVRNPSLAIAGLAFDRIDPAARLHWLPHRRETRSVAGRADALSNFRLHLPAQLALPSRVIPSRPFSSSETPLPGPYSPRVTSCCLRITPTLARASLWRNGEQGYRQNENKKDDRVCVDLFQGALPRIRWTQNWTQTRGNGTILDDMRGEGKTQNVLKNQTGWDGIVLDDTRPFVFQDRCLKPLGHPSDAATSSIWSSEDQERSVNRSSWVERFADRSWRPHAIGADISST